VKMEAKYRGKKATDLHKDPIKNWERRFIERTDKMFRELQTTMTETKRFAVVAFIHGQCVIDDGGESKEKVADRGNYDSIKVKRDGTQMMVIYPDPDATNTQIGPSAINRALRMLNPQTTCHIGLSFGEVNISSIRLIYNGENDTGQGRAVVCSTKDLFGDVVNLAARAAGAGIRDDQKKSTDPGNYYSYLGKNANRKSNFVILIPATSGSEPTMGGVLTKTGLATAVKPKPLAHKGKPKPRALKRDHDHSNCPFVYLDDKKDSFHTIQRSEINAGKEGKLLQWWWTSTK
jgi:hypothetical protein